MTNAIKYGVNDRNDNRIEISFAKEGEKYVLKVSNNIHKNGVIIVDEKNSKFGLRLVQTIAQQYKGNVSTNFEHKAKVEVILYFN